MNRRTGLALILALFILALGCTAFAVTIDAPIAGSYYDDEAAEWVNRAEFDTEDECRRFAGVQNFDNTTGTLSWVIDDEETDWEYIFSHGGGLSTLLARPSVMNPDPSKYTDCADFSGGLLYVLEEEFTESEVQDWILSDIYDRVEWVEENRDPLHSWSNGIEVGEILADQGLMIPMSCDDWGAYLGWYNAEELYNLRQSCVDVESFIKTARSKVFFEYFLATVSHTTTEETVEVPVKFATKYCLEPTNDLSQDACLTISNIADDELSFTVDPEAYTGDENHIPVYIKVRPPEAIADQVSYLDVYDTDGYIYNEDEYWGNNIFFADDDGTFTIKLIDYYSLDDLQLEQRRITLAWVKDPVSESDDSRKILDYGAFNCYVEPAELKPWPAYIKDNNDYGIKWTPVEEDRLYREYSNTGAILEYDESTGILNAAFDKNASISGEPGSAYVWVDPPVGATYYRANRSGGDNIMGKDNNEPQATDSIIRGNLAQTGTNESKVIMNYPLLRSVQAGPVKVYLQNEFNWLYGGSVNVIYWYKNADDEDPFMIEYLIETMDEFFMIERTACVPSENMITKPVQSITVIGEKCAAMNWNLAIRHDLQNGVNAVHYDLSLEDEEGNYQQPTGEKMVFYVPYPDGTGMNTGHEFQLLHFNGSYSYSENVAVSLTPYGVRFEVTSLSPFTLSWGNAFTGGNASELPPTGDNTPIALYAILMLSAAIGLMVSRRKIRG